MLKKVVIVNTHGIGDMVMTVPVILSAVSMGYSVTVVSKSRLEERVFRKVVKRSDGVGFIHLKSYSGFWGALNLFRLLRSIKADLMFPVFSTGEDKFSILAFLSRAKVRIGFGGRLGFLNTFNIKNHKEKHKVDINMQVFRVGHSFVSSKGFSDVHYPRFKSDVQCVKAVSSRLGISGERLICMAPGSGALESHKRWPINKYVELARLLVKDGFSVVVVGGKGEEELGERIQKSLGKGVVNAINKTEIEETVELIAMADCVIANCNGMSHIAAAVGVKVVSLHGPTDFELTGPFGSNRVAISEALDCSPCYRRGYIEGCGNPVCMDRISVERVYREVKLG